jgi:hypothetical protein
MDLLTVVAHELEHLLGHDHANEGLMSEDLPPGVRLTPGGDEHREAVGGLPGGEPTAIPTGSDSVGPATGPHRPVAADFVSATPEPAPTRDVPAPGRFDHQRRSQALRPHALADDPQRSWGMPGVIWVPPDGRPADQPPGDAEEVPGGWWSVPLDEDL